MNRGFSFPEVVCRGPLPIYRHPAGMGPKLTDMGRPPNADADVGGPLDGLPGPGE